MSRFKLNFEKLELIPSHPFTIARGTKETVPNVLVKLTANGVTGWGEAGPNSRYDEDADSVIDFIKQLQRSFFDEVDSADILRKKLQQFDQPVQSAKTAIEMAWLDWWGKNKG